MAPLTNKKGLQLEFLGLATFMGPFISGVSTLTDPLQELVKENSVFDWSPAHQQAFNLLTPKSAKWHYKTHCFSKNCNFLNRTNFAF